MSKQFLRGLSGDILTNVEIEHLGKGKRRLHIMKTQHVEALALQNAEMRNDNHLDRRRGDGEWADKEPFADIPMSVIFEWIQKFKFNALASPGQNGMTREEFTRKQRQLLNMPEYAYCKTFKGRL